MRGEWTTIGAISQVFDGPHATPTKMEVGPYFLSISSLENGKLDLSKSARLSEEEFEKWTKRVTPEAGDLLFSYETRLGEAALMTSGIKACLGRRMGLLRPDLKKVDPRYLLFAYLGPEFQQEIKTRTNSGATVERIALKELPTFPIRLPALPEQKAIAHILGTLDDKIELNRQMNATLEAMAQALFKSWFVDFDPVIDNALAAGHPIPEPLQARANARAALGDARKPLPDAIQRQFPNRFVFNDEMGWVPEGWVISTFGRVSNCFDSKRIPLSKKQREEKKPGAIPYYGATSVMDHVNEWIFDDVYLLVGEDGSVVKQDGTPYVQYIWGRSWVNNHAHVLQGAAGISSEHLLLFISRANISAYVTGAVQPKINQKNLNSIPFLLATDRLNEEFDQIVKPYFERKRSLAVESDLLSKVRDTLLPKLLSGQLRVPEAERQVAEVL